MPPPSTATAAPLSRERVLRAAVALADAGGIEALTMRRLGEELGVEAMSLYRHVANKDDLLDGMVDVVFGEIELPRGRHRLADGDAGAGDLGPRGAHPPPVGDAADAVAEPPPGRRPCGTTTP